MVRKGLLGVLFVWCSAVCLALPLAPGAPANAPEGLLLFQNFRSEQCSGLITCVTCVIGRTSADQPCFWFGDNDCRSAQSGEHDGTSSAFVAALAHNGLATLDDAQFATLHDLASDLCAMFRPGAVVVDSVAHAIDVHSQILPSLQAIPDFAGSAVLMGASDEDVVIEVDFSGPLDPSTDARLRELVGPHGVRVRARQNTGFIVPFYADLGHELYFQRNEQTLGMLLRDKNGVTHGLSAAHLFLARATEFRVDAALSLQQLGGGGLFNHQYDETDEVNCDSRRDTTTDQPSVSRMLVARSAQISLKRDETVDRATFPLSPCLQQSPCCMSDSQTRSFPKACDTATSCSATQRRVYGACQLPFDDAAGLARALRNVKIYKYGHGTGYTEGQILSTDYHPVEQWNKDDQSAQGRVQLARHLRSSAQFASQGDSGAAVLAALSNGGSCVLGFIRAGGGNGECAIQTANLVVPPEFRLCDQS
eukprot:gnl/Spiro4/1190_TR620_c0_g1_i1.p1 gnl/Spiro4/1190_TR620_c0_g1~~gnl/Spiro4/1190_TR620_c0_g1_i1.p1  ORF type:complete len:492 (-),score=101.11 gnl/Spiro4/1190_TR620_c0_g1_i1:66-1499(-)